MQRRGNWLHCFIQAHILAPNKLLEILTWVELLPRPLVLLPLVLLPLLSSSLQQHQTWVTELQKEWDGTEHKWGQCWPNYMVCCALTLVHIKAIEKHQAAIQNTQC